MAKQSGIYRLTISISKDLKSRMDRHADAVNWSATAAAAFEAKLAEIASRKDHKDMTDVIQRFRAQLLESVDQNFKDGFAHGKEWATRIAHVEALQRLESLRRQGEWWDPHPDNDVSAAGILLRVIENRDLEDSEEYVNSVCHLYSAGQGLDNTRRATQAFMKLSFVRGFLDGALSIWDQVKTKI